MKTCIRTCSLLCGSQVAYHNLHKVTGNRGDLLIGHISCFITARKRSLGQGKLPVGACSGGEGACPRRGAYSGRGACSGGCLLWGCCLLGGVPAPGGAWSQGMPGADPLRWLLLRGGTHPTGMQSCWFIRFPEINERYLSLRKEFL